jgi:sulfite oxidase
MPAQLSRRNWLRYSSAAVSGLLLTNWQLAVRASAAAKKDLLVRSENPFNAEPALTHLVAAATTPIEHFYVRSHGPIPSVKAEEFHVRIEGLVNKPQEFSLAQIREKFRQHESAATLTCAGNRRNEMNAVKPVPGVQWDAGAIGHATWTGALLADVLAAAEIKPEAKHVWFEGLDPIKEKDGSIAPFGGSIPLDRAMAKEQPALVAHSMNGQPLAPEHGFPLRTIVPGLIGARSVKWLAKVTVADRPSPNHYVAEAYKLIQTDGKDELAKAEPIYEFPLNSAICSPPIGATLKAGEITVAGYALPPGDSKTTIAKVELSTDGGRTWRDTELSGKPATNTWQLWQARLRLPPGKHELVVRATDSAGRTQPETGIWNLKGYLWNGWHRCAVDVS